MKSFITAASLAALIVATPASAADLGGSTKDGDVSYDSPRVNWTGFWISLEGGGSFANDNLNFAVEDKANIFVDGLGSSGFYGEATLGFDKQLDRTILGIFAGINADNAEWSAGINTGGGSIELTTSKEYGAVAGLRIGYAIRPATAVFLEGGYAYAKLNDPELNITGVPTIPLQIQEDDAHGWFVGLNMESQIDGGLFFRAGARFTDYSDVTYYSDEDVALTNDRQELVGKAGIVYKFNFGN